MKNISKKAAPTMRIRSEHQMSILHDAITPTDLPQKEKISQRLKRSKTTELSICSNP